MSLFPCWRYHASAAARVFNTEEELAAAGEGWVDSPAKLGCAPEPSPEPETPAEETAPEAEPVAVLDEPAPEPTSDDGLDDLDKVDLQELCASREIAYDGRWNRAKLIAKLRGEE